MKNFIIALVVIFTLNASAQSKTKTKTTTTTTTKTTTDKVLTKHLYTTKEKEAARKDFLLEVDKMGLTPQVKTTYLELVNKHVDRLKGANSNKNLTQKQATELTHKIIREQNMEVSRILTVDQYKKHMAIINRYENSIVYRIEKQ